MNPQDIKASAFHVKVTGFSFMRINQKLYGNFRLSKDNKIEKCGENIPDETNFSYYSNESSFVNLDPPTDVSF